MAAEFQAVILAGGSGIRLYPLTENHPKSLLSVLNKPLLWYQLDLLERSGFTEVIVVTAEEYMPKISQFTSHQYTGKISIDLCAVPGNLETAEALRAIQDKIKTKNFFVIAGDLVTDVVIHHLADMHRISDASLTMLLKEVSDSDSSDIKKKSSKSKREEELVDSIGMVDQENRVVFLAPAVYLDEELSIPKALMKRRSNIIFHTNLYDAHFYIFSRWVLDVINEKPKKLCSIKADLVPYLVNSQFRGLDVLPESVREHVESPQSLATSISSSTKENGDIKDDFLKCYAYVIPNEGAYCSRADTTPAYEAMKRELQKMTLHSNQ